MEAHEAADILFTGVRRGRTTIDELAGALGMVIPMAAMVNVELDEVTSAMAAMTVAGIDTQRSATYLRSLLEELADSGRGLGGVFYELSGERFPDFIARGGTLAEALQMIGQHAEDNNLALTELSGRVYAAITAQALLTDNAAELTGNMEAMANATGAADRAFEEHTQTLDYQIKKFRAWWSDVVLQAGERMAPVVEQMLGALREREQEIEDFVVNTFEALVNVMQWFIDNADGVALAFKVIGGAMMAAWVIAKPWKAALAAIAGGIAHLSIQHMDWKSQLDALNELMDQTGTEIEHVAGAIRMLGYDFEETSGASRLMRHSQEILQGQFPEMTRDLRRMYTELQRYRREGADVNDMLEWMATYYLELIDTYPEAEQELRDYSNVVMELLGYEVDARLGVSEAVEDEAEAKESLLDLGELEGAMRDAEIARLILERQARERLADRGVEAAQRIIDVTEDQKEGNISLSMAIDALADEHYALEYVMRRMAEAGEEIPEVMREAAEAYEDLKEEQEKVAAQTKEVIAEAENHRDTMRGLTDGSREYEEQGRAVNAILQSLREQHDGLGEDMAYTRQEIEDLIYELEEYQSQLEFLEWQQELVNEATGDFGRLITITGQYLLDAIFGVGLYANAWEDAQGSIVGAVEGIARNVMRLMQQSREEVQRYEDQIASIEETAEQARERRLERYVEQLNRELESEEERHAAIEELLEKGKITHEEAEEMKWLASDERIEKEKDANWRLKEDLKEIEEEKVDAVKEAEKEKEAANKTWLQALGESLIDALHAEGQSMVARGIGYGIAGAVAGFFAPLEAAKLLAKAAAYSLGGLSMLAAGGTIRALTGLAEGGVVTRRGIYEVGEEGEEWVQPLTGPKFDELADRLVGAMARREGPVIGRPMSEAIANVGSDRGGEYNFEGMFDGATFYVRDDMDARRIAEEIHDVWEEEQRIRGRVR